MKKQSTNAPEAAPDVPPAFKPSGKYNKRAADDPALAKLKPKWIELGTTGKGIAENYGGDRSRACLAFVTACYRAKVPADVIADCVMTWKIGEHVRDQNDVARALKRTMERGHGFAHNPTLAKMNERHAAGSVKGKFKVITFGPDPMYPHQRIAEFSSRADFCNTVVNPKVRVRKFDKEGKPNGEQTIDLGVWWLDQDLREED